MIHRIIQTVQFQIYTFVPTPDDMHSLQPGEAILYRIGPISVRERLSKAFGTAGGRFLYRTDVCM